MYLLCRAPARRTVPAPTSGVRDDDAVEAKETAARAKAELRAKQVAAKSRACILRGKAKDKRIAASGEFGDWPTRWRCYKPGASLKRLRDWLDDDPRNLRGGEEKRLKSLSALLVKAASHDKKGLAGDVDAAVPASQQPADGEKRKFDWDALAKELGINVDGYAHLDDPDSKDASEVIVPEAEQRDAAATALCSVVRHVLSSVTAFWKQKPPWLFACLNLLSALPDASDEASDDSASMAVATSEIKPIIRSAIGLRSWSYGALVVWWIMLSPRHFVKPWDSKPPS